MRKAHYKLFKLCMAVCFLHGACFSLSQANNDSLFSKTETWAVKQNKGLFGLAKPSFGSYTTVDISKIDSAGFKRKRKDSSYESIDISDEGFDVDYSKIMVIEKTKFYEIILADGTDTMKAGFAVETTTHEKKQTYLGKVISKDDEGKDEVLDKNRNIAGEVVLDNYNYRWRFFIKDLFNFQTQVSFTFLPVPILSGGVLKNEIDSFDIQNSSAGIIDVEANNESLATLSFRKKHPEMRIRNDINKPLQQAIATVFAVIIAIKNYQ